VIGAALSAGIWVEAAEAAPARPTAACPIEPERPDQQSMFTHAIFARGRLWVRSDDGKLSSVAPGETSLRRESLPEPALALCIQDGVPSVLTCNREGTWNLRTARGSAWVANKTFAAAGDSFIALDCAPSATTLVTSTRLLVASRERTTSVVLSQPLKRGLVSAVLFSDHHVFVGLNAGEWGGGVQRIDADSGNVRTIERNERGSLCGGPLNTGCDPVHGMAQEPWKPRCFIAAIGLVHLFNSHGRLVEICEDEVRRFFFRPYDKEPHRTEGGETEEEPFSTVSFFGLVRTGNALVAAGIDGLYRFQGDLVERIPLPEFENVSGIKLSFAIPGVVLVLTGINSRRSTGGAAPMLVPR
jgi:hypothetical protein